MTELAEGQCPRWYTLHQTSSYLAKRTHTLQFPSLYPLVCRVFQRCPMPIRLVGIGSKHLLSMCPSDQGIVRAHYCSSPMLQHLNRNIGDWRVALGLHR